MISFECDYNNGAHEKVLENLVKYNTAKPTPYGFDEFSNRAKERIREACGLPDAQIFFLTGGTQTNATTIDSMLYQYEGVICVGSGHINVHEAGAVEFTEHKIITLPDTDGKMEAKVLDILRTHVRIALDYEALIAGFRGNEQDKQNRHSFDMAIRNASQKLGAVQRKRTRLYEDYVEGVLDEEEYLFAKKSYEGDVEKWDGELERLVAERNAYQEAMSPRNLWVKVMRSVRNIKKLTQELVDAVIERIYIYDSGDIHIVMKYQDIFELTKECLEGEKTDA